LELTLNECGSEREIFSVARNGGLALATEDEAEKFLQLRIEGRAGLAVKIEKHVERERIAAFPHGANGEGHGRPAAARGDGKRLRRRREVLNARPADGVAVV